MNEMTSADIDIPTSLAGKQRSGVVGIIAAFLSCLLSNCACADAIKEFSPPMRGEGDPFPARATAYDAAKLEMEDLGRGVVAVRANEPTGSDLIATDIMRGLNT